MLIPGLALIAGAAVLYVILGQSVHAPPTALGHFRLETPRKATDVAFVDTAGAQHRLSAFRGRYVLLNLWATWCAPCLKELPALSKLASKMPPQRFTVIAVALPPGNIESASAYLKDHGASRLAAYFDSQTMMMRSFSLFGLPVTLLIDSQENEIGRAVGPEQWDSPDAVEYLKGITATR